MVISAVKMAPILHTIEEENVNGHGEILDLQVVGAEDVPRRRAMGMLCGVL